MNITEPANEKSVWTEFITARDARKVAAVLKAAGYKTANRKNCHNYVINVARYFEPGDTEARHKLLRLICETAGLQRKIQLEMINLKLEERELRNQLTTATPLKPGE